MSRTTVFVLLLLGFPLGCAQSAAVSEAWREIEIVSLPVKGAMAVRAVYTVRADLQRAREVLLAFERHAALLPSLLESEILEQQGDTGLVRLRFKGWLGMHPRVVCRLQKRESAGRFEVSWSRVEGDFGVRRCEGRYLLEATDRVGWIRVTQDSIMNAMLLSEASFHEAFRRDVDAMRKALASA